MANEVNAAVSAVETAIGNITTAGGYNYDLGSTEYLGAESIDQVTGTRPRVYITGYEEDTERWSTNKLMRRLRVSIRGIMDGKHYRQMGDVTKLHTDIEKALYADKSLGGVITTLRILSSEGNFERESNHPVVDMVFELDIHYTEGTP